jgi:thiamine pyrophosphate-dependent acetolactate synthase large subunit-like protein
VLLHAGSGLLQGAMGIHGAYIAGVPMVVISGESMTYGEQPGFDPGAQWINNLSIPGGTTRLVEPIVKYTSVAGSPYTIYEQVIRAGEMSQRTPQGPTYLSVSTETLMDNWDPPKSDRAVPPPPRVLTAPEDIEKLAGMISRAKCPVVLTEAAGREVESFEALVALCEKMALPVVEKPGALFANFPKDHELHQGHDVKPYWEEMDNRGPRAGALVSAEQPAAQRRGRAARRDAAPRKHGVPEQQGGSVSRGQPRPDAARPRRRGEGR